MTSQGETSLVRNLLGIASKAKKDCFESFEINENNDNI